MDTNLDDHRLAAMRQKPKDLNLPQVVYAPGELFAKNSGRYRIGYTMLEVDGIPRDWVQLCNEMDEIWVPSSFNEQTFRSSGVKRPIRVMPLGFNPDYFNLRIRSFRPSSRYTFLSVFDWGERKAPEILLKAYSLAFTKHDDVLLLLKVFNRDMGLNLKAEIAGLGLSQEGPPVVMLLNQDLPMHQMGSLYRSVDCFVLPTRGEGWGMPILEAMACGLPVIATDWSAQTDYMTEKNAYPLRVDDLIPAKAKCPYYPGFRWAEADMDHLVYLMRYVYNHRQEAQAKGYQASKDALSQWTWRHAAQKIKSQLDKIA
jgi:hypothetical protein